MNAAELLRCYARVADAPDAVARLRQFVLDLAVRGKLVAQDAQDEPASELLKRTVGDSALPNVPGHSANAFPYEVPRGWCWISLGTLVAESNSGWSPKTLDQPRIGDEWGVLKVSAVSWHEFRAAENKQVLPGTAPRLQAQVKRGDFLISRANTVELIARAVIVEHEPINLMLSDKIVRLVFRHSCNLRFVWIVNNYADFARAHYAQQASGVSPSMKNVTRDVILGLPVPLPPLAEQHRIVAKVDELMAMCEQLEAARATREAARNRLAAASLARLNAPDPKTFHEDARFALDALPALTTRPDQIKQLRQTILNLAVRGKLVPQDAMDAPASELMKRIASKKLQQGIEHNVVPVDEVEQSFVIPSTWRWGRIGEVSSKTGSGSTPRGGQAAYKASGIPFLRSQNIYDDGLRLDDVAFIDQETHRRMAGTAVQANDLLLNITGGSMGRCCLVPASFGTANISQHVAIIRSALPGVEGFLHLVVLSPYFQAFVFDEQTGAGRGGLPKNKMDRIALALPPQAEQHRIVAKVDELMALCDRLEASLASTDTHRRRLLEALLHEALQPAEALEAMA